MLSNETAYFKYQIAEVEVVFDRALENLFPYN